MSINTTKKIKTRVIGLIALCAISILIYLIFFLNNPLFFLILVVGSVTLVSTGTIYTVMHHASMREGRGKEDKFLSKARALEKRKGLVKEKKSLNIIEDYMETMPSIQNYVESDKSYEEMPIIENLIFTEFSPEESAKINRLGLSDMDKKQFIREMVYFTKEERMNLIDSMIENRGKIDEEIIYIPPMTIIEAKKIVRVYVISLVKSGEKKKVINVETTDFISDVKERVGVLYAYNLDDFLLSTGGIIMSENMQIRDYHIEDKDEIVLIPSRKTNK
ncbi:MAG: ubiquitin-like protein [Promethearchaeota archaeon]